jgi:hypothetical protein
VPFSSILGPPSLTQERSATIRGVEQPVSEGVRAAVVQVCRDAFYYRDDVRAVFIDAGCPETMYDKYDDPNNSKAKIARFVLNDLRGLGERGDAVQRASSSPSYATWTGPVLTLTRRRVERHWRT